MNDCLFCDQLSSKMNLLYLQFTTKYYSQNVLWLQINQNQIQKAYVVGNVFLSFKKFNSVQKFRNLSLEKQHWINSQKEEREGIKVGEKSGKQQDETSQAWLDMSEHGMCACVRACVLSFHKGTSQKCCCCSQKTSRDTLKVRREIIET